jgi:hypothetical protein
MPMTPLRSLTLPLPPPRLRPLVAVAIAATAAGLALGWRLGQVLLEPVRAPETMPLVARLLSARESARLIDEDELIARLESRYRQSPAPVAPVTPLAEAPPAPGDSLIREDRPSLSYSQVSLERRDRQLLIRLQVRNPAAVPLLLDQGSFSLRDEQGVIYPLTLVEGPPTLSRQDGAQPLRLQLDGLLPDVRRRLLLVWNERPDLAIPLPVTP